MYLVACTGLPILAKGTTLPGAVKPIWIHALDTVQRSQPPWWSRVGRRGLWYSIGTVKERQQVSISGAAVSQVCSSSGSIVGRGWWDKRTKGAKEEEGPRKKKKKKRTRKQRDPGLIQQGPSFDAVRLTAVGGSAMATPT
jgi:hypothetical protein